jgi:hypothetical protein
MFRGEAIWRISHLKKFLVKRVWRENAAFFSGFAYCCSLQVVFGGTAKEPKKLFLQRQEAQAVTLLMQ